MRMSEQLASAKVQVYQSVCKHTLSCTKHATPSGVSRETVSRSSRRYRRRSAVRRIVRISRRDKLRMGQSGNGRILGSIRTPDGRLEIREDCVELSDSRYHSGYSHSSGHLTTSFSLLGRPALEGLAFGASPFELPVLDGEPPGAEGANERVDVENRLPKDLVCAGVIVSTDASISGGGGGRQPSCGTPMTQMVSSDLSG